MADVAKQPTEVKASAAVVAAAAASA